MGINFHPVLGALLYFGAQILLTKPHRKKCAGGPGRGPFYSLVSIRDVRG